MRRPPRRSMRRSRTGVGARGWAVAALALAACAGPSAPAVVPAASPAAPASTSASVSLSSVAGAALAVPDWRPSDRWVFDWTAGAQTATKTAEVVQTKDLGGVRYHVVRVGDIEQYYTADLHWAASVRGGKVETRMVPPEPWFVWPLEVGRRWTHEATWEDREGRKPLRSRFVVQGTETIDVPAGRLRALKVVRETDGPDGDDYWYVPEVRWYGRWLGRRGDVRFEERLREYHPAGRPDRALPSPVVDVAPPPRRP